jgi:hypothetical protein
MAALAIRLLHYHPEGRACQLFEQELSTGDACGWRGSIFARGVSSIRDVARRLQGEVDLI